MRTLVKLLVICFLFAAPAFADSVTQFAFTGNLGNIGMTDTFAVGTLSLPISGWSSEGVRAAMWMKNDAPDEIGIGLAGERDHEISGTQFVQVDLAKIFAVHPTFVTFTMNSIQVGESYSIWGSDTPGQLGTLLAGDLSVPNFTISSNFDLISVASGSAGNVLLNDVTAHFVATPTPEPSTLALMLLGLVPLTLAARKLGSPTRSRGDCRGL